VFVPVVVSSAIADTPSLLFASELVNSK